MGEDRLRVRAVSGEGDWDKARGIRWTVFVEEQNCPPEVEMDEHDETARHILAWLGNEAVGVARWRVVPYEGRLLAKLERFAILPEHRGKGLGRELVRWTIDDAAKAGFDECLIHAQQYLEKFYADLGFHTFGETFMEAGIAHVRMLRPAPTTA